MQSIKTTKKRLVKEILCSTKSICTKIIETIDPTLDSAKIKNIKFNSKAANQDHEESKKIAFILPLSHSSPNIKCNQISIIQSPQSKSKIQSNISHLLEITPKVSKSMLTSFINSNVPKIVESKCNQPLQQLMSIDAKPSLELQTKIFIEQVKKQIELKIKEINNNELHENNSLNKYLDEITKKNNSQPNVPAQYAFDLRVKRYESEFEENTYYENEETDEENYMNESLLILYERIIKEQRLKEDSSIYSTPLNRSMEAG